MTVWKGARLACTSGRPAAKETHPYWVVIFTPMPMPKTVCRTNLYNKIVQLEVRRTFSGRGMGMNITAQYPYPCAKAGRPRQQRR